MTNSCGSSCTYSGWSNSGCSYTQSCTATSESRNCSGNVTNACAGTQTRTRTVAGTCGSCSYNGWGSWSTSGCSYTQSCTATSESRNCSGNVTNACAGTQTRTRTVKGTCGSCSYGSYGSWSTSSCQKWCFNDCPDYVISQCKLSSWSQCPTNDWHCANNYCILQTSDCSGKWARYRKCK